MGAVTQLGYLGIAAKDVDAWQGYAERTLGLRAAERQANGDLLLRMDDHHHRFAIQAGDADDIAYQGWQTDDAAALDEIAARLEGEGVTVARGTREQAERRHVADLIQFKDPDGYDCEVFHGPELGTSFEPAKGDSGFVAGDQGLGHFVLAVDDLDRAMGFYTRTLGLKVSDYIEGTSMGTLGFLHCNPRHHSIAFAKLPRARKRINHFMLQLAAMDDVGRTYDEVQSGDAPLLVTMGRHSNDHMVSFYMANPSNFGVEYGWGAREVDDANWEVCRYDSGTIWGHKPVRRTDPVPQT